MLLESHLEEREGCKLVGRSHNLSDRRRLDEDLQGAGKAEVLLTELKAAAVDVVTRYARENGKEVVYYHNSPVTPAGEGELERFFENLWEKATER